jgi:hypothetical protein
MDSSHQHRTYLQEGIHDAVSLILGDGDSKARSTLEDVAATMLTMAPATIIRGKAGYAASAAVSALNQAEVGDPAGRQFEDLAIGAVKGLLIKGIYDRTLGKEGAKLLPSLAGYGSGIAAVDLSLRRQNISALGSAGNDLPSATSTSPADVSGFRAGQYVPKFQGQVRNGSDASTGAVPSSPEATAVAPQPQSQPLDHQAEVDRMLSFGTPLDQLAGTIGASHGGKNDAAINYRNWQTRH